MIVKVTPLVVSEVFICAATQELQPEQTLVRLLVAAVKEFLTPITSFKRLFELSDSAEAILERRVLHLLRYLFM